MTIEATETPTADPLAEIKRMREELAAERAAVAAERQGLNDLANTLAGVVGRVNPPPQAPPVDEGLPTDEDYERDAIGANAKLAAAVTRRALAGYDEIRGAEIAELRASAVETEWERVKSEDPKNFKRLEGAMRKYFDKKPEAARPGAVRQLFIQLRGIYHEKLVEMDRAERQTEHVANPNPPGGPKVEKQAADVFGPQELEVLRGLRIEDPRHYFLAKYRREPNFEKGYLNSIGFKEE